ncbi:MAG: hypothetical protein F4Y47_19720 [Acidobacteriia bacterium]|nr:hypothetical protein [Terriglobia bacterium]MYK12366.1 hypothetical protein [Terriglobia bacterium]
MAHGVACPRTVMGWFPCTARTLDVLGDLLALAAGSAASQSTTSMVGTTWQATGSSFFPSQGTAERFTTGGTSAGYRLTGTDVQLSTVTNASQLINCVSIRGVRSGGGPATSLGRLTAPSCFASDAQIRNSTAAIDLEPLTS